MAVFPASRLFFYPETRFAVAQCARVVDFSRAAFLMKHPSPFHGEDVRMFAVVADFGLKERMRAAGLCVCLASVDSIQKLLPSALQPLEDEGLQSVVDVFRSSLIFTLRLSCVPW